jgi:hypothetical protein
MQHNLSLRIALKSLSPCGQLFPTEGGFEQVAATSARNKDFCPYRRKKSHRPSRGQSLLSSSSSSSSFMNIAIWESGCTSEQVKILQLHKATTARDTINKHSGLLNITVFVEKVTLPKHSPDCSTVIFMASFSLWVTFSLLLGVHLLFVYDLYCHRNNLVISRSIEFPSSLPSSRYYTISSKQFDVTLTPYL